MRKTPFTLDPEENELIHEIVDRAINMANENAIEAPDKTFAHMDIALAHCHTPLPHRDLLESNEATFGHDFFGILKFIDRKTGDLREFFMPKCHGISRKGV